MRTGLTSSDGQEGRGQEVVGGEGKLEGAPRIHFVPDGQKRKGKGGGIKPDGYLNLRKGDGRATTWPEVVELPPLITEVQGRIKNPNRSEDTRKGEGRAADSS